VSPHPFVADGLQANICSRALRYAKIDGLGQLKSPYCNPVNASQPNSAQVVCAKDTAQNVAPDDPVGSDRFVSSRRPNSRLRLFVLIRWAVLISRTMASQASRTHLWTHIIPMRLRSMLEK
jgi:hypothetical protein